MSSSAHKELRIPLVAKLGVGAAAGVIGTCFIFPLDIIKTRLQSGQGGTRNPIISATNLFQKSGIRGFYKGILPNLIGVTPEKAIKLAINESVRERYTLPNGKIALRHEILAGSLAGFFQVIATNPMELIKIRMQLQAMLPVEERQTTMQVIRHLGISGVYRGTPATLLRDVPFSFIMFPLYSNIKDYLTDANGHISMGNTLLSGAVAGAVSSGAVTPMDVVKTRLQIKGGADLYGSNLSSIPRCFKAVYTEGGIGGLFAGIVPRMCVVAPLFGITLVCFEFQKQYMLEQMEKRI
jgi:hypothetical protein